MDIDTLQKPGVMQAAPAPATQREHLGTVLAGLWMTVGLFLDGYFHQNLAGDSESFLTPWHGVFYSGFAATALWLAVMARRRAAPGEMALRSLPPGYGGARTGLALFAAGAVGDAAWHTAFGVERGIDALLSPTHLVLFAGLLLILGSPVRAARLTANAREAVPSPWILVGSVTSAAALVGFFLNFAWGLGTAALTRVAYDPATGAGETEVVAGVASTLVATVVLFGSARLLLGVGRVPAGGIAVLFGTAAALVSMAFDEDVEGVAAALLAGIALELLVRASRRRSKRGLDGIGAAFGVSAAAMWLVYFGLLVALDGIAWQPEIWLGAAALNGLAAYALGSACAENA